MGQEITMQSVDRVDDAKQGVPAHVFATAEPDEHVPDYELRQGETWASFNAMGDICPVEGGEQGLYHLGRRYLRRLELLVGQQRPVLLHSHLDENRTLFTAALSNPDRYLRKRLIAPRGLLHIRRWMFLWQNCCYTRLIIENRSNAMWEGDCTLWFDADFVYVADTSQAPRLEPGRRLPTVSRSNSVWLGREDQQGARQQMRLDFTPTPLDSSSSTIWIVEQLQAAERATWDLAITCEPKEDAAPGPSFDEALAAVRSALDTDPPCDRG